jgi:N-acetyl-anhydromuramyl-L-alanine amidase AmpD
MIVDHISEGTDESCISWFTSEGNNISSAHFLVSRVGKIYQFVKIEDKAWSNGLSADEIPHSTLT